MNVRSRMCRGVQCNGFVDRVDFRYGLLVLREGSWRTPFSAFHPARNDTYTPVLSEQITETEPRASTEWSFLTIAFRFDMRRTPSANVTVVTMGSPSGIAATASDTVLHQLWVSYALQPWSQGSLHAPPIVNISSHERC